MAALQAYNLVWLSPRFASDNDEQFYEPIPAATTNNILAIALSNPTVDVRLWTDSKRLTQVQLSWLQDFASSSTAQNLSIQDLRTVPQYRECPLYNKEDTSPNWRLDKHSLIWRQVDAARILACLQGKYKQSFYSDADITNLTVASDEVQSRLSKHGMVVSSPGAREFENQLFGFNERCRGIFNLLYIQTLRDVSQHERNGYQTLVDFLNFNSEVQRLKINMSEIGYVARNDGTYAIHPEQFGAKSPRSFRLDEHPHLGS
jgi:hypothetical protein